MTVSELIDKLKQMPMDADVTIEEKTESCDLCSHASGHKCSLEGTWHWSLEEPYLHEESNEVRLRGY